MEFTTNSCIAPKTKHPSKPKAVVTTKVASSFSPETALVTSKRQVWTEYRNLQRSSWIQVLRRKEKHWKLILEKRLNGLKAS